MLDQCHNIEPKIPGQIRSVMNVQEATAKALLVDADALAAAQAAGDVLGANAVLMDAYNTDVRPLLAELRERHGPRPRPDGRLRALRLRRARSSPSASAASRRAGAHEHRGRDPTPSRRQLARPLATGWAPTRATRTTRAATPRPRASGIDPVTGAPVELLWVKGSGGDLGTLTEAGLAVLRLDRLRALVDVYPGVEREDEMVAAFDYCLHGKGGAAPSIDTAMHGLVDAAHVDHLHPDSGIAFATAADGEALTAACFGDRVAWVPWRRPGLPARPRHRGASSASTPRRSACILGGHGITAWGDTSEECEANSLEIIRTAERYIAEHGRPEPFGPVVAGYEPLPTAERRARAAALLPLVRGLASTDRPQVGHYTDSEVVLDFLGAGRAPAAGRARARRARTTSCGPRSGRWSSTCRRPRRSRRRRPAARAARRVPRRTTRAYYERHATPDSPPMRGADPAIVLVPGVGHVLASARTSRPRASPASSTSTRST